MSTQFKIGLRVVHKHFGQGHVISEEPLQIEFYREPIIKTFYGNTQHVIEAHSVIAADRFNVPDRVTHDILGNGLVVQKNKATGEICVLFNATQDGCCLRTFPLNDVSLRKI